MGVVLGAGYGVEREGAAVLPEAEFEGVSSGGNYSPYEHPDLG